MTEPNWSFGLIEGVLASEHLIAQSKRTAFQARLKNFHRLGLLPELETVKGKAAKYRAGDVFDLALAVELTQLGLPPDRIVGVLLSNRYSVAMAARMAADSVKKILTCETTEEESLKVYVYLDPEAMEPLTAASDDEKHEFDQASRSFFYGGSGVLHDILARADLMKLRRLSIVNITAVVFYLAFSLSDEFPDLVIKWANDVEARLGEGQYGGNSQA